MNGCVKLRELEQMPRRMPEWRRKRILLTSFWASIVVKVLECNRFNAYYNPYCSIGLYTVHTVHGRSTLLHRWNSLKQIPIHHGIYDPDRRSDLSKMKYCRRSARCISINRSTKENLYTEVTFVELIDRSIAAHQSALKAMEYSMLQ